MGISNSDMISGETDLPEPFEHWIIKFAGVDDFHDMSSTTSP